MKKIIAAFVMCTIVIIICNLLYIWLSSTVFKQKSSTGLKQTAVRGIILDAKNQSWEKSDNHMFNQQKLTILLDSGKIVENVYESNSTTRQQLHKGEEIILTQTITPNGQTRYYIVNPYRFDRILYLLIGFFLLVFFIAGKKGMGSILGLGLSFITIVGFIIPQILAGKDPVLISVGASFFILFVTTYIAHGISKSTTVALVSTYLALLLTILFAFAAVSMTMLTGYPNEEATDLHFATTNVLNVKGLFLAGIIITTLGALNDVTITQSTALFHLAKRRKKWEVIQLAKEGFIIGREHAVSLINTLVLAYAGSSLSVLIYFFLAPTNQPIWSIVSNELVAEEIVKTFAGTAGLIMAVPIVTFLAAFVVSKKTDHNRVVAK